MWDSTSSLSAFVAPVTVAVAQSISMSPSLPVGVGTGWSCVRDGSLDITIRKISWRYLGSVSFEAGRPASGLR